MDKKPLIITLVVLIVITLFLFIAVVISKKSGSPSIVTDVLSEIKTSQLQGLKIEVLREGAGNPAQKNDRVIVKYVGTFKDGTQFASSDDSQKPITFVLGQNDVIRGWELGVLGMKMGEKRRLTVPSSLAYGKAGKPPIVPPNTPLIFDIELLAILVK